MSRAWNSKSLGSPLQHRIFYALLKSRALPLAYILLFCVVFWYTFAPVSRRKSHPYLRRRFPEAGWLQLWRHTFCLYWQFGKILVGRARAGLSGKANVHVPPEHLQALECLLQEDKGLILLSAHVGAWQMTLPAFAMLDVPVHLVEYRDAGDTDKRFFEHGTQKPPFSTIDPTDGVQCALSMLHALRHNQVVALLGDRVFAPHAKNITVPFLGGAITVPALPFVMAATTGTPIGVSFARQTGLMSIELSLAGTIRVAEGTPKNQKGLEPYAREFSRLIEEYVMLYPYDFFNFYDLWEPDSWKK